MKRVATEPKPIEKGAAYKCGYEAAANKQTYQPAETFEWKQGYWDCVKGLPL